jgi:hypothetical protein
MAVPATFRLVRADDHIVADVSIANLKPFAVTPSRTQPSPFVLKPPPNGTGTLRVRLQAQQIVEYATPVGAQRKLQPMPIFTGPTDVVVHVPANDPGIPLSVAGILDALGRLPLHVAGTDNTRFVLPHRFALRPHDTAVLLRHLAQPALRSERVELWHSTLERITPDPAEPGIAVLLDAFLQSESPIAGWAEIVNEAAINNALSFAECVAISAQSQPTAPGAPDVPGRLHRLVLSSLGAWLDLRGSWPSFPEYQHRVAMGRDVSQRVVATGRLFPFGHAAILTSDTERDFETSGASGIPTGRAAALSTVSTITVTQPEVRFPLSATDLTHVGWPYEKITLLDRVTPRGNEQGVVEGSAVSKFMVPGPGGAQVPFAFTCVGVDRTGQSTQFSMPLLFVPTDVSDATAATLYNGLDADSAFKKFELGGQALGLAPEIDADELGARADAPERDRATTVLASRLAIKLDAAGRPLMESVRARVNALERYGATKPGGMLLRYAAPYTKELFAGANAQGQVFLQLGEKLAVDLGKKATASLATVGLPVAGLSREFGALAGAIDAGNIDQQIADLAQGKIDLAFLDAINVLFGIVPIKDLIPAEKLALGKNQKITTKMVNGVATTELVPDVPLLRTTAGADQPYRKGFVGLAPFRRNPTDPHDTKLRVHQTTTLDTASGVASSTSICAISSVALQLFAKDAPPNPNDEPDPADDGSPLVTVPFVTITFISVDGDKPEVDVDLGPVCFGGFLRFLGVLADLIDQQGFRDPPALAVDDTGVTSSFVFPIPAVAVGVFSLENITFATSLRLPFTDQPLTLGLGFAQRENPFVVTVAALGGGGYLEIELNTGGLQRIAGSIEFGARLSIDLVIAKASVEAMGGVYANYAKNQGIAVVAFFRIRGELEVLSLVSVSVTFTLALEYVSQGNQLFGKGEIAVNVTVVFFSETVVVPFERRFAGQNADPTFAELMAPDGNAAPWDDYCRAFAAA